MFRFRGGKPVMSSPATAMCPVDGATKPAIIRRVVVLPHPEGPSSVRNSPSRTDRSSGSTAAVSP